MLKQLLACIKKEILLLIRDIGGLVILFIMPLILVVTVTKIQKSTYDSFAEATIPVLFIDHDQDSISAVVKKHISQSGNLKIVSELNGKKLTEDELKSEVFKGKYQVGIVIPERLSKDLDYKINQNVEQILNEFAFDSTEVKYNQQVSPKTIKLYFDPATSLAFKDNVSNVLDQLITDTENKSIYKAFQQEMGSEDLSFQNEKFIHFQEIVPEDSKSILKPNVTQHNVPAWTLFAIFFIVVPLSINIVKEKSLGTHVRLLTSPMPYSVQIIGKTITYLAISLFQFTMILGVAKFVFPLIDLPSFKTDGILFSIYGLTVFASLAAIGLGLLIGTIAKTQEQSAPFGATLVVILAAIGGVWIPVFAMSDFMQHFAKISPMNWALDGYYSLILRNQSFIEIVPNIILLILFYIITLFAALYYDRFKRED
ncbi:ABC transporter permease [Empedobacter falsenii]|uniref:ABC transporter permease n=1 Tax=Empedobacter falsenii TaxID=343874 RepID=A0ABY8VA69_9FLAO|nr:MULTISPECIES: ABC transporter permease [Empedobacter]MCA4808701.1 ABC transporter permease [Empedobacter stercoris]QNT13711.1 ABC transporter permease [Empedobacter stercoris]WIH98047.1 ABC transporter permease [Empedobacter falsenii]